MSPSDDHHLPVDNFIPYTVIMPGNERKDVVGLLLDVGRRLIECHQQRHCHRKPDRRERRPVIQSIDPINQSNATGPTVTIRGRRLRNVVRVYFGEASVEIGDAERVGDTLVVPVPEVGMAVGVDSALLTFPTGVAVALEDHRGRKSDPLTLTYENGGFPGGFQFNQVGDPLTGPPSFGRSVSLSDDGNLLAVGSPAENNGLGATYIYILEGTEWVLEQRLQRTTVFGARQQGYSVSLAGGVNFVDPLHTRVAVGCPGDREQIGSVDIWRRDPTAPLGSRWSFETPLNIGAITPEGPIRFGSAVSMVITDAGDNTVAVGAPGPDLLPAQSLRGSTWIFTQTGGDWNPTGIPLVGSGSTPNARQGFSVQLNEEGNFVIIGGPSNAIFGAGWIFERTAPGQWIQRALLNFPDIPNIPSEQGYSVSIDVIRGIPGSRAVLGSRAGQVATFERVGDNWVPSGTPSQSVIEEFPPGTSNPSFGTSVRLFTGGNMVAIGIGQSPPGTYRVLVYERVDGSWTITSNPRVDENLTNSDPTYGSAISLSRDNRTLAIGAPGTGRVYVYFAGTT